MSQPKSFIKTIHLSHAVSDCYCFDDNLGTTGRPTCYFAVNADSKEIIGTHVSLNPPSLTEAATTLCSDSVEYTCETLVIDSPEIQPSGPSDHRILDNLACNIINAPTTSLHAKGVVEKYFNTMPSSEAHRTPNSLTGRTKPKMSLKDLSKVIINETCIYNSKNKK